MRQNRKKGSGEILICTRLYQARSRDFDSCVGERVDPVMESESTAPVPFPREKPRGAPLGGSSGGTRDGTSNEAHAGTAPKIPVNRNRGQSLADPRRAEVGVLGSVLLDNSLWAEAARPSP